MLAIVHPWASASSYLSSQSVADSRCNPHATPRSSYPRRSPSCRFFLCRAADTLLFSSRATRWRQGLLRARPRHADDQPTSDRGETAPPSAPARAHSVNTYARPSTHGNIRASRAHSITCSADHIPAPRAADDLLGRAERPPHTISQAHNHPQRAAAHRAALPAKPAPHSTVNRRTAQHITQPTPARDQQRRRTRVSNTHTRTAHARRTPAQRHTQSTLPISSSSTALHNRHAHSTVHPAAHTGARTAPQTQASSNTHTRTAHARRTPPQRSTQSTPFIISSSQPATSLISHPRAHTTHYRLAYCSQPRGPIRTGESACGPGGSRSGSLRATSRLSGSDGSSRRRTVREPVMGCVRARV